MLAIIFANSAKPFCAPLRSLAAAANPCDQKYVRVITALLQAGQAAPALRLGSPAAPYGGNLEPGAWKTLIHKEAAKKSSFDCHDNYQTALCVTRMEVSEHGSSVFIRAIRVIRVIRGLFTVYFGLMESRG